MNIVFPNHDSFPLYVTDILQLYNECFGHDPGKEYFLWKYLCNPYDGMYVALGYECNRLIGFYAVSPIECIYNARVIKAALSLNTMTSPDFSGKGIFQTLATRIYERLSIDGFELVIGFPNTHSNRIFGKWLGFSTLYEIPMLEKTLCTENLCNTTPPEKHFQLSPDPLLLLNYEMISAHQGDAIIECRKTVDYLRWRYSDSPENKYLLLALSKNEMVYAYGVLKAYGDRLNIVEQHAVSEIVREELFYQMERYAVDKGFSYITTWAPLQAPEHWMLEKRGYINRYPIHYFIAKWIGNDDMASTVLNYYNWGLQLGDNNTY